MEQTNGGCAAACDLRVKIVDDYEGFARLKPDWNTLFEHAHNAAPPLHFDWVSNWLDVYGRRYMGATKALRIICCLRGDELVGLIPLYMRRPLRVADGGMCLMFTSTGEQIHEEVCPDYMDLLCLAEVKDRCAELAWNAICKDMDGTYDRLELSNICATSPLVRWAREHGPDHDLEIVPQGQCCISSLRDGMEAYLSRLSHKMRAQARRLLRAAEREGVVLEVASDQQQIRGFFNDMVELHQKRWKIAGEPGVFSSDSFTRFHRALAEKWGPEGRAILSRVRYGECTIAAKYGFLFNRKFDYYQSGVRLDGFGALESPGTLGLLLLMRHLSERGAQVFDFLQGSALYKQRLATGVRLLVDVRRVLWSWRTMAGFAASLGSRCVRKAARTIGRRRLPARVAQFTET